MHTTTLDNISQDRMSNRVYNGIIGLTLLWGFAINYLLVTNISPMSLASIGAWPLLIGYFISCLAGIWLFKASDTPALSFLGYNLVVVPFGLVLNLFLSEQDPTLVKDAITITMLVTGAMMALGTLYPAFFKSIGTALFVALLCTIVAELVMIFAFNSHPDAFDWIVAVIFCGYIGYDWAVAQSLPCTVDNAIDSAASLYIDIINLFVRIIGIKSGD